MSEMPIDPDFPDPRRLPGMPSLTVLQDTDDLLDRLGQRGPCPDDLDDPLSAALALLAAEVDVDPVPAGETRRALSSDGCWPLRQDLGGLRLVRDADDRGAESEQSEVLLEGVDATAPSVAATSRVEVLRVEREAGRANTVAARVGPPTKVVGIRLVPALVVAAAAIVLSMGAAAALSHGETLNPARMLTMVVQEMTEPDPGVSLPAGASSMAEVPGLDTAVTGSQPSGPAPSPSASISPTSALLAEMGAAEEIGAGAFAQTGANGPEDIGAVEATIGGVTSDPVTAPAVVSSLSVTSVTSEPADATSSATEGASP